MNQPAQRPYKPEIRREPKFKLVPFDQIKMSDGSDYLIKGLIPREGLVVIWGAPKCGKSFWVYDLTMHIAMGAEYRGRRVHKGAVVYVCLEGERGIGTRTEAWRREFMGDQVEKPAFYLITTRMDLATEAGAMASDIRHELGKDGCVTIVIDTLNRSLNGSESSDQDMSAWIKGADRLRAEFDCTVIVIHHCGHEASRPRGHTSLLGAADAQIAVKRGDDEIVRCTVEYMKDGAAGAEINSRLKVIALDDDSDGDPRTSCVIEPANDAAAVSGTNKTGTLSDQHKLALTMLRRAISEAGEIPPSDPNIPKGFRAVKAETWRRYCYAGTLSEDTPEARRKAFQRATTKLQALGIIATKHDWVWLVSK